MRQWSWKMCLQGVSLIMVFASKSSTQIAQLSWFSLCAVFANFFLVSILPRRVSFCFFCCSYSRWACSGSCLLRSSTAFISSIALFDFARYLQNKQKLEQQQHRPRPSVARTIIVKRSNEPSASSVHKNANFLFSRSLRTFWPQAVTVSSKGFSKYFDEPEIASH